VKMKEGDAKTSPNTHALQTGSKRAKLEAGVGEASFSSLEPGQNALLRGQGEERVGDLDLRV